MADVRDLTTEELFAVLQPGVEESVKATLEKFIGCELEESIGGWHKSQRARQSFQSLACKL